MGRFLFYSLVIGLVILGLGTVEKGELSPVLFTAITASFAYEAYRYNKEKFRLELFEKRWEVYRNVIVFQGVFLKNGGLVIDLNQQNIDEIEGAIAAARESFVDIGWHKSKCLFGDDVIPFFQSLENVYMRRQGESWNKSAGLAMYGSPDAQLEKKEDIQKIYESVRRANQIFTPYLYFGDYKNEPKNEYKNLCALCSEKMSKKIKRFKAFLTCSTPQNSSNLPVRKDSE